MTQTIAPEMFPGTLERQPKMKVARRAVPRAAVRLADLGAATVMMPPAPNLDSAKDRLVERVYNDFCRRRARGEAPDPDQLCDRFPSIRSGLIKMIQCHGYLADNIALAGAEKSTILWPELGETFLDFDLLQELGQGAFARVFLASEPKLGNRLVAVKIAKDGGSAEAKILGRLKHPNIVPVYSVREDAVTGLTAVCMPYVGSATLDDVLDHVYAQPTPRPQARHILEAARALKHPLDAAADAGAIDPILQKGTYVDAVRSLGAQLADALAFIHGLGVLHRDLKPSNVLMSPQGVPMLLDFNLSIGVTQVSSLFGGTLPYMSPEQLQAADLDGHAPPATLTAASDIFSFGVILFQLLTGQHPYGPMSVVVPPREVRQRLLLRHLDGAKNARLLNPDIDPAFSQLLERCLAYNPTDRPQSAAEVARALRSDLSPRRRARRWIGRRPRTMVAGLLLGLVIGLVGAAAATVYAPRREHPMDVGIRLFEQKRYAEARDAFNQAIEADPNDAQALFARGRTYQHMGATGAAGKSYRQFARNDFDAVEKLKPDARHAAGIGYEILQMTGPIEEARQRFQWAIDNQGGSAEVYNNHGYCQQQQNNLVGAEKSFGRAIQLDPRLQIAYYNRARLQMQWALQLANELTHKNTKGHQNEVVREPDAIRADIAQHINAGIKDVEKAIEVGPGNASLNLLAARLYAVASGYGRESKNAALDHLGIAVAGGLSDKHLAKERTFEPIAADQRFLTLCKTAASQPAAPALARYLDPLQGRLR